MKPVCSTLNRSSAGYQHLLNVFRPLSQQIQTIGRPYSFRQLVASSFVKVRTIFKYVLGKNPGEIRVGLNYSGVVRNVSGNATTGSLLGRLVVGRQFPVRRFNGYFENSRFKLINRKHLTGTGLTLSLVGVCMKSDSGFPDLLHDTAPRKAFTWNNLFQSLVTQTFELKELREDICDVDSIKFGECISKGCNGVVYQAQICSKGEKAKKEPFSEHVAVKMLFNYDIESVATRIITATAKECVPYNGKFGEFSAPLQRKKLPPHPHIIKILSVFVDYFQPLEKCRQLYPHALPSNLGGFGRNQTLFIVMQQHDTTLKHYLSLCPPSPKNSLAIFTQCMDAINFLYQNNIAHRDLKPDNLLLSLSEERDVPWVVISDFGLCSTSLAVPFQTDEVCRGGNRALMPPEICNAKPAPSAVLDYSKSDLWAMGAIAYEIFGADNPFYRRTASSSKLDSATYKESDLPPFPQSPHLLTSLISTILRREPSERPTTQFAYELTQLLFHMGSKNIDYLAQISSKAMRDKLVDEWFKMFVARSLYQTMNGIGQQTNQYKMKLIFLAKLNADRVKAMFEKVNAGLLL